MHCCRLLISTILLTTGLLFAEDAATLNRLGVEACNREEFDKAVPLLTNAYKAAPENATIAKNLAAACCALAYKQDQNGAADDALLTLRNAATLLPADESVHNALVALLVNLGSIALRNNSLSDAQIKTDEALRRSPENAIALLLAGDIAYREHDLQKARKYWERARTADPSNRNLEQRLEKIGKEITSEQSFSRTEVSHFDIRFDYRKLGNSVFDIRDFLMEAYSRVGQDLDLFPPYSVAVILYGENEFRLVNNVPAFVAGLYDGKIRVPVNFSRYPLTTLKGILFHEYTHAVIHAIAGPSCPIWLNEGIAMREMNACLPVSTGILRSAIANGTLLPFEELGNRAVWNDPQKVSLAYAQSWMMADYLYHRWSNSQVRRVLARCKEGTPVEIIMREELGRTPEQFAEEWKTYANSTLH